MGTTPDPTDGPWPSSELARIADRIRVLATHAGPAKADEEFTLLPPVGWLNRIDDLLIHHGATDHHGSNLGEALGNLIRSWDSKNDPRNPDTGEYQVEHWGPREAA